MKDSAVFQASLAIHTGIVVPFKDRFPQRIVAVLRSMLIVLALRDRFPCLQRRKELCIVCRGLGDILPGSIDPRLLVRRKVGNPEIALH